MAEAFGHTYCSSTIVPESKLSHTVQAQYGFVPKLCHRRGKNSENLFRSAQLFFSEAKRSGVFASDDDYSCIATSDEVRAGVESLLASTRP